MAVPEEDTGGGEGGLKVERRLFIGGLPAKATEQVPATLSPFDPPAQGAPMRRCCDRAHSRSLSLSRARARALSLCLCVCVRAVQGMHAYMHDIQMI